MSQILAFESGLLPVFFFWGGVTICLSAVKNISCFLSGGEFKWNQTHCAHMRVFLLKDVSFFRYIGYA